MPFSGCSNLVPDRTEVLQNPRTPTALEGKYTSRLQKTAMLLLSCFLFVAQHTLRPIFLQVFLFGIRARRPIARTRKRLGDPVRAYTAAGGPPSPFPNPAFRRERGVSRLNCRILYSSAL